jgi:hypothetical protein
VANLTVSIDDQLLKRARIKAIEQDTSVNALVRDYLERFATESSSSQVAETGMEEFLAWAKSIHASSGPEGRTWTRDELYER